MSYFIPSDLSPEPASLVFTGMMAYVPNSDGMLYFLDEIFPLIQKSVPHAKIYIVGNNPPRALQQRASESVIVTGFVDDVRPYVWRSSVYVVPLRMGGGTRLKVLEAMAMKKPIVTTAIGCEGIDLRNGESALVLDQPQMFASAVVELLGSPSLRERLTTNGYELVRSRYQWDMIVREADRIYHSLLQVGRAGTMLRSQNPQLTT